jgi:drug/metabolite transporter (DMT)-like permease
MVSVGWALAAALAYGVSDFLAGLAARRDAVIPVTLLVYAAGLVTITVILIVTDARAPSVSSLGWGALSGCGLGAEALALIAGFRRAAFSIAAPLSAVIGASLAILAGVLLGERPSALSWAGVILAVPATVAVSASVRQPPSDSMGDPDRDVASAERTGLRFGLIAGVGTAVYLIGLSRTSAAAGVWPVLSVHVAALATLGCVAAAAGELRAPELGARSLSGTSGILGAGAAVFYLLAVHAGLLAVAAVVTSLFPVVTVGLAVALAGERLGARRLAGLGLATVALALIALGSQA